MPSIGVSLVPLVVMFALKSQYTQTHIVDPTRIEKNEELISSTCIIGSQSVRDLLIAIHSQRASQAKCGSPFL